MASRVRSAAETIRSTGYAAIKMSQGEQQLLNDVWSAADKFFSQASEEKLKARSADKNAGYRTIGEEYSQSADRPDLNQSFSVWGGEPQRRFHGVPLGQCLTGWQAYWNPFLEQLFTELRAVVTGTAQRVAFIPSSYAQVNYYEHVVDASARPFLQDAHEDGHLVTLLTATAPGIEISESIDGVFRAVDVASPQLLIMPGSALEAVSDGFFKPLYHRVRNLEIRHRKSLMYFVNPDLTGPVYGWTDTDMIKDDLGPQISSAPEAFGLPPA